MHKGVFAAKKKDGAVYYRASITYKKKHISLGGFPSEELAAFAYNEANRLIITPALTIHSHYDESPLPFEKWVILLNYRDNGIYFSTPIYARSTFFYYYLSPSYVLKFDIDDLFYYSETTRISGTKTFRL